LYDERLTIKIRKHCKTMAVQARSKILCTTKSIFSLEREC
jgi:hypothetical protein